MAAGRSLRKMDVIINVVLAEAVVSRALGAVAELQIGEVRVRPPAHAALVPVALLGGLFLLLLDSGFELDGLVGAAVAVHLTPAPQSLGHVAPEEYQEVQKGDDRQQRADEIQPQQGGDDVHGEQGRIGQSQPLDLEGDEKEQQYLSVRIEGGKGQEHGHADVIGAVNGGGGGAEGIVADDAGEDGQHHAGEVIEIELRRAPLPLQEISNKIGEIQREDEGERIEGIRHENKAHQTPQLQVQHFTPVEAKEGEEGVVGQPQQQKDNDVARHDVAHQVRDAEIGMAERKAIHGVIEFFQSKPSKFQ